MVTKISFKPNVNNLILVEMLSLLTTQYHLPLH